MDLQPLNPADRPLYLDRVIASFKSDPADSDFQDGFAACAHAIRDEGGYHMGYAAHFMPAAFGFLAGIAAIAIPAIILTHGAVL